MKQLLSKVRSVALANLIILGSVSGSVEGQPPQVEQDGTIHVPAFKLPESSFLSKETRAVLKRSRQSQAESAGKAKPCPSMDGADRAAMPSIRQCEAQAFY